MPIRLRASRRSSPNCNATCSTLIVLEATGGFERAVVVALSEAGLPVAVVNPRQVRDYAKATGRLAKTDALDAHMLAEFARAVQPSVRDALSTRQQALADLMARRRQVVQMLVAEHNRLFMMTDKTVRADIEAHIEFLQGRRNKLDGELLELVQADSTWQARFELCVGVPGIGQVVALTLLAELPELGTLN